MSFIAKNPLILPKIESAPSTPPSGTRGIYAKDDGWYDIDDEGNVSKISGSDSGSGVIPEFANSIEECTDTTKLYVLPDGYIYAYMFKEGSGMVANFTNQIPISIDTDGSVYNGMGWKDGYRLNSSGEETAVTGSAEASLTGYIQARVGDVFRLKDFVINPSGSGASSYRIGFYDESFKLLTIYAYNNFTNNTLLPIIDDNGYITQFTIIETLNNVNLSTLKYIRITAYDEYATSNSIITRNEEITYTTSDGGYQWTNTGHAFVSVDYEDRISNLENNQVENEARFEVLENNITENDNIPDYWISELENKADVIRLAMEIAGQNKSSFLWYTDAHWTYGNAKISPVLLKYLWKNTPINKVNFGGDIVVNYQDRKNMKYLYNEWRSAIKELPNHHSVIGNHDVMVDYPYTFLIAPEESADMVMGNGMYYYIDNHCEKTRYLYLEHLTSDTDAMREQGEFIVDALLSTPENWHIVAISHRWFQYTSTEAPTVGSIPAYNKEILQIFDEYNSRTSHTASTYFTAHDFTDGKAKVEFCIGGHIHVDHDFTTDGGIPVIITASDTNQERSEDETEDSGTLGTTTESAVYGIIADYNDSENTKITVVGVGRGTSREI